MRAALPLLIILATCVSAFAAATRVTLEPLKHGVVRPRDWEHVVGLAVPASTRVELDFVLKHKPEAVAKLDEKFWALSAPGNTERYMTRDEVNALMDPGMEVRTAVLDWLKRELSASAVVSSPVPDVLRVVAPLAEAEALLQTKFAYFKHTKSTMRLIRAPTGYTVPQSVAPYVSFVTGVQRFPRPFGAKRTSQQTLISADGVKTEQSLPTVSASDLKGGFGIGVTPRLIREKYSCDSAVSTTKYGNRQAIASFLGQYFDEIDLQESFTLFMQENIGRTPDKVIGSQGLVPGVEADLDIQYIMSVGLYTSTWAYSTDGYHEQQEPFFRWTTIVANESDAEVPKVISISYGDDEDSVTMEYMTRVSTEMQKMGTRGISILFASGDDGSGCQSNGNFEPNFPAELPTVTSVGGTTSSGFFEDGVEITNSLSGGGFSNRFDRPPYQKAAVAQFFASSKNLPPANLYNQTGRGYPDVAALSSAFWVVSDGIPLPVAGTSCAAPSFSAVVGLLNEVRLSKGKKTLGFLNPTFYALAASNPTAFNDVTSYCSAGCNQNNGFCAVPAWDAATGWGSPNFSVLSTLI